MELIFRNHISKCLLVLVCAGVLGSTRSLAQTGMAVVFANQQVNGANYTFDVLAAGTAAGSRIGDLQFYVNYDSQTFGSQVVAGGKVTVTPSSPVSNAVLYRVQLHDNAVNRLAISIEYLDRANPANGTMLSAVPTQLLHVQIAMTGNGSAASLSFESGLMTAQQYQSDATTAYGSLSTGPATAAALPAGAPSWSVNPASFASSLTLTGKLKLGGAFSTNANNVIAAFSGTQLRGVALPVDIAGQKLFFMTIYAATGSTEAITFQAYDAAKDATVNVIESITFSGNTTLGSIVSPTTLTGSDAQQVLSLDAGWNLISLNVTPGTNTPTAVFGGLGVNLKYVTGFDGQARFFDPNGLSFLNTLSAIELGKGYWVKTASAANVTVTGTPVPNAQTLNLTAGWNLIGYWPNTVQAPASVFATLITQNKLQFVTTFKSQAQFFDPTGLSFLNTLSTLQKGQGYWVKLSAAASGFAFPSASGKRGSVKSSRKPRPEPALSVDRAAGPVVTATNRFMFVGGFAFLDGMPVTEGSWLRVETGSGLVVGAGRVGPDAQVSAVSVYGDDLTSDRIDGALDGEGLYFALEGAERIESSLPFSADMSLRQVMLQFEPESGELPETFSLAQNYPNPFRGSTTIRYGLAKDSHVQLELFDLLGRRVSVLVDRFEETGFHEARVGSGDLASGVYYYVLKAGEFKEVRSMHRIN